MKSELQKIIAELEAPMSVYEQENLEVRVNEFLGSGASDRERIAGRHLCIVELEKDRKRIAFAIRREPEKEQE